MTMGLDRIKTFIYTGMGDERLVLDTDRLKCSLISFFSMLLGGLLLSKVLTI